MNPHNGEQASAVLPWFLLNILLLNMLCWCADDISKFRRIFWCLINTMFSLWLVIFITKIVTIYIYKCEINQNTWQYLMANCNTQTLPQKTLFIAAGDYMVLICFATMKRKYTNNLSIYHLYLLSDVFFQGFCTIRIVLRHGVYIILLYG